MIVFDALGEYRFKFCIVVYKRFLKFLSLLCLLMIVLHLFELHLDQLFHLNATYVYAEEVVFTFLVFALLEDK